MKQLIFVLIVMFPYLCFSQNMRISKKGNPVRDVYALSDVQKVTFSDFNCAMGMNDNMVIKTFKQMKSYPNPFSNQNTIEIDLSSGGKLCIDIYNSQGMLIRNLEKTDINSGIHKYVWDGRSNNGSIMTTGLYFYQVKLNNQIYTNKTFLIK